MGSAIQAESRKMSSPTSSDFGTNSGSVSSGKLDKAVSFQVAGSGGVTRFSLAGPDPRFGSLLRGEVHRVSLDPTY